MNDIKDLFEWALAPIIAVMVAGGKILHGHGRRIAKHETGIALLVNGHQAEAEKRTEQRAELIDTMKKTDGKIDDLTGKFNDLLLELAAKR